MKTPAKAALLVVATLAVLVGTVHLFLPGGLPAAFEKAFRSDGSGAAPRAETPPESADSSSRAAQPKTDDELHLGEKKYDAGEFGTAIQYFLLARADVAPNLRERAERGLQKAVLAWALTTSVAAVDPMPQDVDAEIARRQAAAELVSTEKAWYDLAVYAAGCGAASKLPFLAQQAIDRAQRGGPVETRLKKILEIAGPRTPLLRDAMVAADMLEPEDPVAAAIAGPKKGDPVKPVAQKSASKRPRIYVPSGDFKEATKVQLKLAVGLEEQGAEEYDLCGPDDPLRKEHRKSAIEHLTKARDIYQAAQDELPESLDLGRRLQSVMEMISHLHKEMGIDD
jgi:hypothetical protein